MPSSIGTVTVSTGSTTVGSQTIPRGVQIWTVGTTGAFSIIAAGAAGAHGDGSTTYAGGRGAVIRSQYTLTAGSTVVLGTLLFQNL